MPASRPESGTGPASDIPTSNVDASGISMRDQQSRSEWQYQPVGQSTATDSGWHG